MAVIGVEEDEIRRDGRGRQVRPALFDHQADGAKLAFQRLNRGVGPVQHDGARAAQVLAADAALHVATRSFGAAMA